MDTEIMLITYDSKEDKITREKIKYIEGEYENKDILYGSSDITTIVCYYVNYSVVREYTRLLLREVNRGQVKRMLQMRKELYEANRIYTNTLDKLLD